MSQTGRPIHISSGDRSRVIDVIELLTLEDHSMPETTPLKDEAHKLVESLPDDATWADLLQLISERHRIDEGIADCDEGRTWTSDQIREKLGIPR